MMYSRLKLARNLLREDGVIFISMDESEMPNLRKICDQIFGEENHIADLVWNNKKGGENDAKFIAVEHEYIVMYAKNDSLLHKLFEPYEPEYLRRYNKEDDRGKFFWDTFKRKSGKQYYPIKCPDGIVLEYDGLGNKISWLRSKKRFLEDLKIDEVKIIQVNGNWSVYFKQRLPKGKKPRTILFKNSVLTDKGTTSTGSAEVLELFSKAFFSNPKPSILLKNLAQFSLNKKDIVLDFFAGSGTTGDAVMQLNAQDGGKTIFFVNVAPYDLIACFDKGITEELVKKLATHKPVRVVFRDNSFISDAIKINAAQIFRQFSPATDVKSI